MKYLALTISVFLVVLGAYASRRYQISTINSVNEEVLSESEETGETQIPSPTLSPTQGPVESASITPRPQNQLSVISGFIYPGSHILTQTQTALSLESSDDTDVITDWYKDKIKEMGANVKSFVVTRANDKVLNKLVGANAEMEVSVEISKDPGATTAKISVTIK